MVTDVRGGAHDDGDGCLMTVMLVEAGNNGNQVG